MSAPESVKHAINTAVAAAPAVSYLSDASVIVTIAAGIVSILWMGALLWKMFFPEKFHRFVQRINGGKK